MLSAAFTSILKSGREEFNTQYALARRQYPALEAEVFSEFLRSEVDPLVQAVHSLNPEAAPAVAQAAYEAGLELAGQRLVGAAARSSWIQQTWRRLLPAALPLVSAAPRSLIGPLSNAAHQIGGTPGAKTSLWLDLMERLAPLARDAAQYLASGQVTAWRCGLAHYRESALAVAQTLPPELLAVIFQDPEGKASSTATISPTFVETLRSRRWSVGFDAAPSRSPLVQRTGAFRGFGGLFPEPPQLLVGQDQLFVQSGTEGWLLTADAFGATFHRATEPELATASPQPLTLPAGVNVPPDIGDVTSVARLDHTLAITGSLTHAVLLFSLSEITASVSGATPPPLPGKR